MIPPNDSSSRRDRRIVSRWRPAAILAGLALAVIHPNGADAHGPAPAALDVAAVEDGTPSVVQLSEGIALGQGRWTYLCPAYWGEPAVPFLGGTAESLWVVGTEAVFRFRSATQVDEIPVGDLADDLVRTRAVVNRADDTGVLVLVGTEAGADIWAVDGQSATRVTSDELPWRSMIRHNGRVVLAALTDGVLRIDRLGDDGTIEEAGRFEVADAARGAVLRTTGDELFAVLRGDDTFVLTALADGASELLIETEDPIHGPVARGDDLWIATGGRIVAVGSDGPVTIDEERRYTCLGETGALAFACAQDDVYALTQDGVGERVFAVQELTPPPPDAPYAASAAACDGEWLDFFADAGMSTDRADYEEGPSDPADAGSGGDGHHHDDGHEHHHGEDATPSSDASVGADADDDGGGCAVASTSPERRAPLAIVGFVAVIAFSYRAARRR